MQSGSASPAIAIAPRSVVQVRMPEDGSTGSGAGEGEAVPTVSAGDEGNLGEENELWEDDDEEEVDEINHAKLPREAIRAHSPGRRAHTRPTRISCEVSPSGCREACRPSSDICT